jgi:hypothetical protein
MHAGHGAVAQRVPVREMTGEFQVFSFQPDLRRGAGTDGALKGTDG